MHALRKFRVNSQLLYMSILCEIFFTSHMVVKGNGLDTDFGHMSTVTLTLEI